MELKKTLLMLALAGSLTAGAVTLNVKVPEGTRACYVSGKFNNWATTGTVRLQPAGDRMFTVDLPDVSEAQMKEGYKYLCGPDWKYVEKTSSGGEVSNRTSGGNPDVGGSWAASYNPDLIETTINIDGYTRKLRISLPPDYETSGKDYPVVYMVGVQQRYADAGSDVDAGDDFFGDDSWNAHGSAATHHADGKEGCILVGLYTFVAESIPFPHPDFMGSGASEKFIGEFIDKVVGYVNSNYRTRTDAASTTILGADLGGLLSIYASLSHPDVFGNCVSMSPLLMLNQDELVEMAANSGAAPSMRICYGSLEEHVIADDAKALAAAVGPSASVTRFEGGWHDDNSWREEFHMLYPSFADPSPGVDDNLTLPAYVAERALRAPAKAADFAASEYQFYYKEGSTSVALDSSVKFSLIDNYVQTNLEVVPAQVAIKLIPKSVTNKVVYWNVARLNDDGTSTFLSEAVKNVSFSTKKTKDSWMRVTVRDGEALDSKSVSSGGFKVYTAEGNFTMTPNPDYTADATVTFPGNDKTFTIHYGSVNSESDMGEITGVYSVAENCIEATLLYDFTTNAVKVTETKWGATVPKDVVSAFTAVPSVTTTGKSSKITVRLTEGSGCTPTMTSSLNYGTESAVTLTQVDDNTWEATLSSLKAGIYTLSLDAANGTASREDVGSICIKVLSPSASDVQKTLTVNAYSGIDWANTGRYKANFHTHTSQSFDTKFNTDYVVDAYAAADYKILALTDHDANPYPWNLFDLYNRGAEARDPEALGMMAIPGVELSKDNSNSWNESTGGEFNHHNDFFTGRKGQEFASLQESYAYTEKIGGLQIINHPGQYWNIDTNYAAGAKNSPEWHARNFQTYASLIGLEVYNQGNRRPNDRILWDQILYITMPSRPVWGYSCDDTHTAEQYFRNYQFMLMPEFTVDALKEAMQGGHEYFSYEYNGSGQALAPRINSITTDSDAHTITIDTDAPEIYWISGTDIPTGAASGKRKSTVVGMGRTFDYTGFRGSYVRALLKNDSGETATQPFGFEETALTSVVDNISGQHASITLSPNPAVETVTVTSESPIEHIEIFSAGGARVYDAPAAGLTATVNVAGFGSGAYIVAVSTADGRHTDKLIVK